MSILKDIIQQEVSANQDQRSSDWYKIRLKRFTASEMHCLFTKGSRPMTEEELENRPKGPKGGLLDKRTTVEIEWGDTAISYIMEKIAEEMSGVQASVQTKETAWGQEYEGPALGHFHDLYDAQEGEIEYPGFITYGEHAGGSPDGIFLRKWVLEAKCPYNSNIHLQNLRLTVEAFPKERKPYWHQIQTNIVAAEAYYQREFEGGLFISYDPRLEGTDYDALKLVVLKIPKDPGYKQLLDDRLEQAVKKKQGMIEQLAQYRPPEHL